MLHPTSCKVILTLPLILLVPLVCGGSMRKVEKVVYHEGATEINDDHDTSSSFEDIPPREEWFRVRGQLAPQKAQRHGARDIIALSSTSRTATEISSAARSRYADSFEEENNNSPIQVHVRPRGKVGVQSSHRAEEPDQKESREQQFISTRRFGDDQTELSKLPSGYSENEQKNWYQRIRHESGHQSRGEIADNSREGNMEHDSHSQQRTRPIEVTSPVVSSLSRNTHSHASNEEDRYYEDEDSALLTTSSVKTEPEEAFFDVVDEENERLVPANRERDQDKSGDPDSSNPPPHDQVAKMARYIVKNSNWVSVATISTMSSIKGYPFVNVFSLSDGPISNSSGIPYMYLTPLDMTVADLKEDNRASATMSLAQSDYCKEQQYDPEDPRCAHVILSGKIVRVRDPDEIDFARNALYSRHPEMKTWPKDHGWFFAKLQIERIVVLDYFGGAKTVSLEDYFGS